MPRYRFNLAVVGELEAPDIDNALSAMDSLVDLSRDTADELTMLDVQVYKCETQTLIRGMEGTTDQYELVLAQPSICS